MVKVAAGSPFPSWLFPASLISKAISPERFLGCLVFFWNRPNIPFIFSYYLQLHFKCTGRRAHKAIRSALYRGKHIRATHLLLYVPLSLHSYIPYTSTIFPYLTPGSLCTKVPLKSLLAKGSLLSVQLPFLSKYTKEINNCTSPVTFLLTKTRGEWGRGPAPYSRKALGFLNKYVWEKRF